MELKEKASLISETLEDLLGVPTRAGAGDVLECLILTILSQNTTDVNRDKGYAKLKERFPTWENVLQADVKAIETAIKIAGLGNQKKPYYQKFSYMAKSRTRRTLSRVHP